MTDWIDEPKDRYCCPDTLVSFAADLWPKGIDRDAFWDPETRLVSRDPYSIRRGDDTMQLNVFAPDRITGDPTLRVHANGPYSRTNRGMMPEKWVPRCVQQWEQAGPLAELLTVSPLSPAAKYWRESVWPHASVVLAGRVNFEIEGEPTTAARGEVAMGFFSRSRERHVFVARLAARYGWATARLVSDPGQLVQR